MNFLQSHRKGILDLTLKSYKHSVKHICESAEHGAESDHLSLVSQFDLQTEVYPL